MISHLWPFSQHFSVVNLYTLSSDIHSHALSWPFSCLMTFGTEGNLGTVASFRRGWYSNKRQKRMKTKVEVKTKQISKTNAKRNANFCWQISIWIWIYCIRWQMEAVSSQGDKWVFFKCVGAWEKSNSQTKKNIWLFLFVSREEGKRNQWVAKTSLKRITFDVV